MLVPRSVAGTKRRHPLPGGAAPAAQTAVQEAEGDEALASALLNWLSPWWCARRDDTLAQIVQACVEKGRGASTIDVHVARLLDTDAVRSLGCTSSAVLAAAIRRLEAYEAVHIDAFRCRFHLPSAAVVFVRACSVLQVAEILAHLLDGPCVLAVYPPSPAALENHTALDTPSVAPLKSAYVVLDEASARDLCAAWGWDRDRAWLDFAHASSHAKHAAYAGLRAMPASALEARAREYTAWQRELVQRNVLAAQQRTKPPPAYPSSTIVQFTPTSDLAQGAYKAHLARHVPNGVDYVELRENSVYVRCANAHAAQKLVGQLAGDALAEAPTILRGAAEAVYWQRLPQRVRNAALRRAA